MNRILAPDFLPRLYCSKVKWWRLDNTPGHLGAQKGTAGNWGIAGNPSSKRICCASSNANDKTIVGGCCTESKPGFIFTGRNARNSRIGLLHLRQLTFINSANDKVCHCLRRPRLNVAAGMDEASVLTCRRSNENRSPITHEKRPNQRAGSNSCGLGMGSVQGIQVSGLFGRDRQMDKLLYRE